MLAIVAIAATAAPVFTAALSGLLPDVLDGDRYILGRSVFSLTGSGTQIIGLGIGGAVLAAVPARWLLLAAGGSLVAAAAVTRLGRARPQRGRFPRRPASRPVARVLRRIRPARPGRDPVARLGAHGYHGAPWPTPAECYLAKLAPVTDWSLGSFETGTVELDAPGSRSSGPPP
jgi:hypothetical protein